MDAIKEIMGGLSDELVICSTGMICRMVCAVNDRRQNFYMMGSMGSALAFGIGIALNTKRKVVVIAGDGDLLMSLGALVLMRKLDLQNLELVVIDNNCYSSTGCQPTCSDAVDFSSIVDCRVYKVDAEKPDVGRVWISHKENLRRFQNECNRM